MMKAFFKFVIPTVCLATFLCGCMTDEEKNEKETAKHQANFLNSTPPPMSKPQ